MFLVFGPSRAACSRKIVTGVRTSSTGISPHKSGCAAILCFLSKIKFERYWQVIGTPRIVRSAVFANKRARSDGRHNPEAAWIEAPRQFRSQQYLIEHVPKIVYLFGAVVEIGSSGITLCVSEMTPH